MGKLLRVLTVFFFLLSAGALTLGISLFNRRELLMGRTKQLEEAVIELASYIEDQPSSPKEAPYTERDISDCTPKILVDPERGDFWATYAAHLEEQGLPSVDVGSRRDELKTYYRRSPITLEIEKDEYGLPITTGKGTMHNVLRELIGKAEEQLNRLNATRQQLTDLRQEMVRTVDELNTRKGSLRESLAEGVRLNENIGQLETNVSRLNLQVDELEAAKRDLQDQIGTQKTQITELKEELQEREETITRQREEIKTLRAAKPETSIGTAGTAAIPRIVSQGPKGSVISINAEWKFVVIELNADFMAEINELKAHLAKKDVVGSVPAIELMIRRPGRKGKFVTKARLIQLRSGQNLGVADVLPDWQQLPVQPGDVVFY